MTAETRTSSLALLLILGGGLLIGLAAGAIVFFGPSAWPGSGGQAASGGGPTATPAPAPVAGAPAPDFTLKSSTGEDVSLSSFKGQVVLVNFWATWCGPCRYEMPIMQDRFARYQDQGFMILAVDADEPVEDVAAFGESLGLTFPLLLDPAIRVTDLYRVRAWPTTYLVDRDGLISKVHLGVLTESQLDGYLADLGLSGQAGN